MVLVGATDELQPESWSAERAGWKASQRPRAQALELADPRRSWRCTYISSSRYGKSDKEFTGINQSQPQGIQPAKNCNLIFAQAINIVLVKLSRTADDDVISGISPKLHSPEELP